MFSHLFWVLLLLFSSCLFANAEWSHTVVISTNGHDTSECLSKNFSAPCRTLDFVLNANTSKNSTELFIQPGNYYLNTSFIFWFTKQLAIIGESLDAVVHCSSKAGLSFIYSEDIVMENLTLSACGAPQNSTSRDHPQFLTGLFFVNCFGLKMDGVLIENGPGIGVQLYDVSGTVTISNCVFLRNGNKNSTNSPPEFVNTGGGIYFEYTYKGGLWPFKTKPHRKYQENSTFHLCNTKFEENWAPEPNISDKVVVPNASDHVAFSRGGGVSLFFKGKARNNTFWFSNCSFNKNHAMWGGGLFVEFHDQTSNNEIIFNHSQFYQNIAKVGGGGVRSGLITMSKSKHTVPNNMNFISCIFKQNKAILGGAVSLYGTTKPSFAEFPHKSFVNFTSCVAEQNYATVGSAFGCALWDTNQYGTGDGLPLKVSLMNSSIEKNEVIFTEDGKVSGIGAFYSQGMPIVLSDDKFKSNNGSALVLDNVVVHIKGDVLFQNNSGRNGGAIAIYGRSKLKIAKKVELKFVNNVCHENGGAIYVQTVGPLLVAFNTTELNLHGCFVSSDEQVGFYPDKWDFNVTFIGNKGPHQSSGNSIFATTLQFCREPDEDRVNNAALQWKSFHYFLANGTKSDMKYEITTNPVEIKVNENEWNVPTDKIFSPTMKLIDEKNNSVYGIIDVKLEAKPEVVLASPSPYYLVKDRIGSLVIQGKPYTHYNIKLSTVNSQLVFHNILNAHIENCSPGFVSNGENKCECDNSDTGVSRCEDKDQNLFLLKGYWGGYDTKMKFVTAPCPYEYCHCISHNHASEGECFFNMSNQCNGNRQGQLCGICKKNFSLKVGEDNCVDDCETSLSWVGYLIALVVFLTLLVLVIMFINFDPFSAYLNAWLYSYQVILLLLPEGVTLDPFLLFIVGLANVRILGLGGVCMWSEMDDLQKLAFNYFLPVYVIFCLFVLNRLALACGNNCFTQRLTQTSTARALCTLIVLSYSTVTYISLSILYPVKIGDKYFVFYQGTVEYFGSHHIVFAIPAIFLLIFVGLLFPLMLIFRQWFTLIDHGLIKLLLDNFQNCFRDGYKWCAGFYFVCRFLMLLIGTFAPPGALKASLFQSACSIILTVFVLCRPYDNGGLISYKILNISDAVLLCNLCVLTSFSSALSGIFAEAPFYKEFEVLIYISGYVPLLFSIFLLVNFVAKKYFANHVILGDVGEL